MSRRWTPTPGARRAAWCSSIPTCSTGPSARTSPPEIPPPATTQFSRAVALARVDELIGRLPAGVETIVGEAGSALSGGERQRVSIARALLKAGADTAGRRGDQRVGHRERGRRGRRAHRGSAITHPGDRCPPAGQHPPRRPGAIPRRRARSSRTVRSTSCSPRVDVSTSSGASSTTPPSGESRSARRNFLPARLGVVLI